MITATKIIKRMRSDKGVTRGPNSKPRSDKGTIKGANNTKRIAYLQTQKVIPSTYFEINQRQNTYALTTSGWASLAKFFETYGEKEIIVQDYRDNNIRWHQLDKEEQSEIKRARAYLKKNRTKRALVLKYFGHIEA